MDELVETSSKDELRQHIEDWRSVGEHVALVPTTGELHDGHLNMIKLARQHAERVVVSIFAPPEEFSGRSEPAQAPRSRELDVRRLKRANTDLMFAPEEETMFPFGVDTAASVTMPVLTGDFCGEFEPGHFDGVTSVVTRLFSLVQPDVAIFGQKDYQQLLIVQRLVKDMSMPIDIISAPTVREEDGLAMSSRNQRLDETSRAAAPELYKTLTATAAELEAGEDDYAALETTAAERLRAAGFEPDYVSIRRADDLSMPEEEIDDLVIMAAAAIGGIRLIDNVIVRA